ncbi:hypothetical protein RhiirA1_481576 [Rhizophagus irregularis]|uniref:Amidohydrolase 3 domain-containing protein n=1 Tax=Rhizophagus irregularis TaxID=588596 RepID=A0A2N0QMX8_9GLOM|nr:hypothetical protein RhiirA1_481576 [Rhizophagus irregularis]
MLKVMKEKDLPITKVAELTAQAPAERFGITQKGRIAKGYDADFAVVEEVPFVVTKGNMMAKHKQSIYAGYEFPHRHIEKRLDFLYQVSLIFLKKYSMKFIEIKFLRQMIEVMGMKEPTPVRYRLK